MGVEGDVNQKGLKKILAAYFTNEEQTIQLPSKIALFYWSKKGCDWSRLVGVRKKLRYFESLLKQTVDNTNYFSMSDFVLSQFWHERLFKRNQNICI